MSDNPAAHKGSYHQLFHSIKDKDVEQANTRTAKEMNRLGVNAWEVCLEKKSTELGRPVPKGKFELPPEVKNMIWKLLGSECENRRARGPTAAMLKAKLEAGRKRVVDALVEELLKESEERASKSLSNVNVVLKSEFDLMLQKVDLSPDDADFLGEWPKLDVLVSAFEEMGYECMVCGAKEAKDAELVTELSKGWIAITIPDVK